MATVKKTITVTEKQDDWIRSQVESGEYVRESDYIRELLRKDKKGENYFLRTKALEQILYFYSKKINLLCLQQI